MSILPTRKLGRTGVELSTLGLGTAPLGDLFAAIPEPTSQRIFETAWEAGIRYVDTAPWYGRGQSEHRVGRALYQRPRNEFVLSTKVGRVLRASRDEAAFKGGFWAGGLAFPHRFDYSYDGIMRSYEDSQQRLGMSRIDLLLIHDLDIWHHRTEARVGAYLNEIATGGWRALSELRDAGLVRGIGAGINEMGMMPRFLDLVDLDFFLVAMPYTLLDQDVLDADFPSCAAAGIGIVVGAPFASGILASGPVAGAKYRYDVATPDMLQRVERIAAVCARHDATLAQAALQFPLGNPLVASVIPGAIEPFQVESNVASMTRTVPSALWQELKSEGLLRPDAPTPA